MLIDDPGKPRHGFIVFKTLPMLDLQNLVAATPCDREPVAARYRPGRRR
jgi:hypothetical protein